MPKGQQVYFCGILSIEEDIKQKIFAQCNKKKYKRNDITMD